jgi:hypothetical protein
VPTNAVFDTAYSIRRLAALRCSLDSHIGLPPGIIWQPTFLNRTLVPGDTLNATLDLQRRADGPLPVRYEMRGEGLAGASFESLKLQVPAFNDQGWSRLEVKSKIPVDAPLGWRIIRAKLTGESGQAFWVRSSLRIAPPVDVTLDIPSVLTRSDREQIIKSDVIIQSNSSGPVKGVLTYAVPEGWTVRRGQDGPFSIALGRGRALQRVEIVIPAKTEGLYTCRIMIPLEPPITVEKTIAIESP